MFNICHSYSMLPCVLLYYIVCVQKLGKILLLCAQILSMNHFFPFFKLHLAFLGVTLFPVQERDFSTSARYAML